MESLRLLDFLCRLLNFLGPKARALKVAPHRSLVSLLDNDKRPLLVDVFYYFWNFRFRIIPRLDPLESGCRLARAGALNLVFFNLDGLSAPSDYYLSLRDFNLLALLDNNGALSRFHYNRRIIKMAGFDSAKSICERLASQG